MDELIDIAKQVVDKTKAQYGILHRPNKGPDYIMVFNAYGNDFVDPATGNLLLERDKLAAAFGWFERGVKEGVIPANNTAMEFDALRKEFYTGNAAFWMYGIWDLGSVAFPTYGLPKDEKAFFADWGWIAGPAAAKGGSPVSLTHPVVYVDRSEHQGARARRAATWPRVGGRPQHRPCGDHDAPRHQARATRGSALQGGLAARQGDGTP